MDDQRIVLRAAFRRKDLRDRLFIERARLKALDGLRRDRDDLARAQKRRRALNFFRVFYDIFNLKYLCFQTLSPHPCLFSAKGNCFILCSQKRAYSSLARSFSA